MQCFDPEITPDEATHIAWITPIDHNKVFSVYQHGLNNARRYDPSSTYFAQRCAIDAVYVAGYIDGIRAERERRREYKSR